MPPIQPPPLKTPYFNAKGQLDDQWQRFFLGVQSVIAFLITSTGGGSSVSQGGLLALALSGTDRSSDDTETTLSFMPGPRGQTGAQGPQGLAGLDGQDGEDGWPGFTSSLTRSGLVGLSGPVIVAYGRAVAQAAAVASLVAYTVGASDSSFLINANVLVTTATLHAFTVECAYTDEGNTARVLSLPFSSLAGAIVTSIANGSGAVPYEGVPLHIRCKAATTITLRTQAAGVYTTIVYNIEGSIAQLPV